MAMNFLTKATAVVAKKRVVVGSKTQMGSAGNIH